MAPTDCLPLNDFLLDEAGVQLLCMPPWEPRSVKKQPCFERYHEELFLSNKLMWPLSESDFVRDFGDVMLCLSQRAREVVYLANRKWPLSDNIEAGGNVLSNVSFFAVGNRGTQHKRGLHPCTQRRSSSWM